MEIMGDMQQTVKSLAECAVECQACAGHDIEDRDRPKCAKVCIDCGVACAVASGAIARGSDFVEHFLALCATLCDECADECDIHDNEHCKQCSEVCRRCAAECRNFVYATV